MSSTPYGSDVPGSNVPPGYPAGSAPGRSLPQGLAVASLVLGIIGVLTSWILIGGLLGLVALILGFVALGKAKRGEAGGRGMAIGGIVTGAIALLITIGIVALGASFLAENSEEFSNLTECVEAANNDQTKIRACQDDFRRQVNP